MTAMTSFVMVEVPDDWTKKPVVGLVQLYSRFGLRGWGQITFFPDSSPLFCLSEFKVSL
jgi:hypothetical protein